jgi:hypothetical protein
MPLPDMLAHLQEQQKPSTLDSSDPRTSSNNAAIYQVIYHAACHLAPPTEHNIRKEPAALLKTGGHGQVEEASENLIWALLYNPRSVWLWRSLAEFYQSVTDDLLCEAASSIRAQVCNTFSALHFPLLKAGGHGQVEEASEPSSGRPYKILATCGSGGTSRSSIAVTAYSCCGTFLDVLLGVSAT